MLPRKLSMLFVLAALVLSSVPIASAQPPSTYAAINVTGVTSGTPAVGSDFTTDVQVSINTTGPGVVGIEIFLFFDDGEVTYVDTDSATPGVQPGEMRSGFFGTNPIPAANEVIIAPDTIAPGLNVPGRECPNGDYPCVHLSLAGPAQTNKTDVVARLHWKGVSLGDTDFFVLEPVLAGAPVPNQPRTALVNADGYLIPLNVATAANFQILGPGQIGGIVLRQGVPPSVPNTGTQGCTQIDATNGAVVAIPAFTLINAPGAGFPPQVDTAGGFLLNLQSGAGTYTIRASYPGYLQSQKSNVFASGGQVLIGSTRLYGGDVNGDNAINILDIVAIIGNLGAVVPIRSSVAACDAFDGTQTNNPPPPDSAMDINDDGRVDISDLAIAAGNFGKVGPTTWAP